MDADGSGSIDVDEMWEAFQLLKIRVSRQMVGDMLAKVDSDGSGQHWASYSICCTSARAQHAGALQHVPCSMHPVLPYSKAMMPSALPQQAPACRSHEWTGHAPQL